MKGSTFQPPRMGWKFHKSSMRQLRTARYGYIDSFGKFEHGSTLVLSQICCTASGLALLEDEQNFKLGDVFTHIKCQFHVPTCRVNV
jgi:hypothetical protein